MTRFTPGPWQFGQDNWNIGVAPWTGAIAIEAPHDPEAGTVPSIVAWTTRGGQNNANAHLIAAAPELYEALFFAFNYIAITKFEPDEGAPPVLGDATYDKVIAQSGAALRKARGETP